MNILFRNLIDNAIRYKPVNGKVSIYSDITDQHVIFEVIDNGPGIGKQELDRVYRKADTGQSGSGLGGCLLSKKLYDYMMAKLLLTPQKRADFSSQISTIKIVNH